MAQKRVQSVMILHTHKINFLREMSLNLIKSFDIEICFTSAIKYHVHNVCYKRISSPQ